MIEQANLRRPEIVKDIADAFLDAGAGVLVANTAGANRITLASMVQAEEISEGDIAAMARQGAAICRAAISDWPGSDCLVFGEMGPTGKLLLLDEIDATELYSAYAAQAEALAEGGADAIICQSFTEIESLCVAIRAAVGGTGLPVIGSMSFDCGADRTETTLGVTPPQACAAMLEAGACVIGADCGVSPDDLPAAVALMRQSCQVPIWVKVNAGTPQVQEGRVVYPETPEEFARRLPALVKAGANLVGGCCGASAEHIASLAAAAPRSRPDSRG